MFFAFLVSFVSFVHISVGGELYISELLFSAYLLFSFKKIFVLAEPFPRKTLLLGGLWLLSQIVTDLVRDTPPENFLRGGAAIIFFLIDFCAVYIMVRRDPDVVRVLILGSALGTIFSISALPTDYSEVEPWKFGYGSPVTTLVVLFLSTKNWYRSKIGLLLLMMLGVLGIYLNARSLGGITILTASILYLSQQNGFQRYANQRGSFLKLAGIVTVLFLTVAGIASVYQWAAESGYLPENVTEKYQMGKIKDSEMLGIILGGRPEILISSQAVIDSPIIGHGSWAADQKYSYMRYEIVDKLGLDVGESYLRYSVESSDLIPTHSVLMQAWVWAGLFGAVFWLFVLRFLIRNTLASCLASYNMQPLVVYIGISSIWGLLFSPFGGDGRMSWGIALVILCCQMAQNENHRKV